MVVVEVVVAGSLVVNDAVEGQRGRIRHEQGIGRGAEEKGGDRQQWESLRVLEERVGLEDLKGGSMRRVCLHWRLVWGFTLSTWS